MSNDLYGITNKEIIINWIKRRGVNPLFLVVTGSHMWNLNREDSDLDIRGIYLSPTDNVLSLYPGRDNIEATDICENKVDIQLYELKKALTMLASHNGNILEMMLSPTVFFDSEREDWRALAKNYITKRLANYYLGYFHSQRKRAATQSGGKALVYTYREIMAGTWLMKFGEIIYNFLDLKEKFQEIFNWKSDLLDLFMRRDEYWNHQVSEEHLRRFEAEWFQLSLLFQKELEQSSLPPSYENINELDKILIRARKDS